MNELSKEVLIARCEAAIKQLEPCTGTAERQSLECFRIALQSLLALQERAEPVAIVTVSKGGHDKGEKVIDYFQEDLANIPANTPLYAAPPAPVVPECFARLHRVIKERHHGRMPEDVQKAFDECSAMLNKK